MATTFESIHLDGIRKADLQQLETYIYHVEEEEVYWGNKKQFDERHKRIKKLIVDAVAYAYSEGVKMPKARSYGDHS